MVYSFIYRTQPSYKKEDKKLADKDKDVSKKPEAKGGKSVDGATSNSSQDSTKRDDKKHSSKFIFFQM